MRRYFLGGNWKMHGNQQALTSLVEDMLALGINQFTDIDIAVFPSFVYLPLIGEQLKNSVIGLGAQNQAAEAQGAYTGEVAPAMLSDIGCRYVLLGHSERRHLFSESNEVVAKKLLLAKQYQLLPVLCVGETESEFQAQMTASVIEAQLNAVVEAGGIPALQDIIIAYEPVWAIGTGRVATPEIAQQVHAFIRRYLAALSPELADSTRIIYGGSLKPDNAAEILAMPDVDGGLIGGASLKAADFVALCQSASK